METVCALANINIFFIITLSAVEFDDEISLQVYETIALTNQLS